MDPIFLSHVAVRLRDSLAPHRAVPAALVLSTLQDILQQRVRAEEAERLAVEAARSLQDALFLHDLDWKGVPIRPEADPSVLYAFSSSYDELPTGILTASGNCYSPLCQLLASQGHPSGCYAFACPRRSLAGHEQPVRMPTELKAVESAPLVDALAHQVRELFEGEQAYYDDLCLVETAFVQPLRTAVPPIITPSRLENFLDDILLNFAEIREHSRRFLASLGALEGTAASISDISRVVATAAESWAPVYLRYTTAFPLADSLLRREKSTNSAFSALLEHFHNHPLAARRGFDTFHSRPTFRALRYKLMLEAILRSSSPSDAGRPELLRTIDMLGQQSSDADLGVGKAKRAMAVRDLRKRLRLKDDTELDLHITSATCLEKEGPVHLRDSTGSWRPAHLFLLDNFLVVAKAPRVERDGRKRFTVKRRPIPLDLLQVLPQTPPERAEGLARELSRHQNVTLVSASQPARLHAVRCQVVGPRRQSLDFYADSRDDADNWRMRLQQAISARQDRQGVHLDTLLPADARDSRLAARIRLAAHPDLLVTGGLDGFYVGWTDIPHSHRRVAHLPRIEQLETHTPGRTLFVLAAGVLLAYPFDAFIPTVSLDMSLPQQKPCLPLRISGRETVTRFALRRDGKKVLLASLQLGTIPSFALSTFHEGLQPHPQRYAIQQRSPCLSKATTVPNLLPISPSAAASFARYTEFSTVLALLQRSPESHLLVCDDIVSVIGLHGEPTVPPLFRWYLKPHYAVMLGDLLVGAGPQGFEARSAFSGALMFLTALPFCGLGTFEDGGVYAVAPDGTQQEVSVVVSD
ncbi:hypothetical protein BMF94_4940 [Rhodotorula taiwanensis]|uniref:DH domain-containing protein n=1 Tax=Rhodotorula taiwanensis TaxID=741276 RepID=A0A2S5B5K9_9BASI|nr:hypothetical protein BMF94_4940 [Rhodotorula taiwanensis]